MMEYSGLNVEYIVCEVICYVFVTVAESRPNIKFVQALQKISSFKF